MDKQVKKALLKKVSYLYPQLCEIALKADVTKGLSILEKMHSRWGGRGLMELSYIGHLRAVIASKFKLTPTYVKVLNKRAAYVYQFSVFSIIYELICDHTFIGF